MTRNDRLGLLCNGSEGFPRICSGIPPGTPNVLPQELRPDWLSVAFWEIPLSETDDWWLKICTLASSQLGRKGSATYSSVSCGHTNPLSNPCAITLLDLLNSSVKYLDGISDRLGCVSQHRNRSMVVVSSKNPQNNKGVDLLLLWNYLNIKS
jgi:hypothetical protein